MYGISNVSKHEVWKFGLVSKRERWFFSFFAGMFIRYRFISRKLCNVMLWICLLCSPCFLWPSACAPWIFIFFYLKDSDILITVLFISISHLGSYGTCCPWLGATQSCCLFFWAGVLRALQKHTLHCSAVARYPDWDTWASPIQTYCSLPPSGDIMPLSLNLLCIAEGLLTPTRSSHICLCPWMGRREECGKWIFGRRKWGCSKGLEATGRQFEAALETKRCSYAWSGT